MSKLTEAQRLAQRLTLSDYYEFDAALHCPQAAAELLRQEALIAELAGAINRLDDAICGDLFTATGRHECRLALIGARAALAKVKQ